MLQGATDFTSAEMKSGKTPNPTPEEKQEIILSTTDIKKIVSHHLNAHFGKDAETKDLDLIDSCHEELNFLGHLAFLSLSEDKSLGKLFEALNKEDSSLRNRAIGLDFFQKIPKNARDKMRDTYSFIHSDLKEFFAAYYLFESLKYPKADLRFKNAMQFLRNEKYNPRYFKLFRFVSGLCSQDKTQDKSVKSFWKALLSSPLDMTGLNHSYLMIRCLSEGDNDDRIPYLRTLQEEIGNQFKFLLEGIEAEDKQILEHPSKKSLLKRLLKELKHAPTSCLLSAIVKIFLNAFQHFKGDGSRIAAEALGDLAEKISEEQEIVIEALVKKPFEEAAVALGKFEKDIAMVAIQSLLVVLKNKKSNEYQRRCAIQALGWMGEKAAIEPVFEALVLALNDYPYEATFSLTQFRKISFTDPSLIDTLAKFALSHGNQRIPAIQLLGNLGERAAIESVLDVLTEVVLSPWAHLIGDLRSIALSSLCKLVEKAPSHLADKVFSELIKCIPSEFSGSNAISIYLIDNPNAFLQYVKLLSEKGIFESPFKFLIFKLNDERNFSVSNIMAKALAQLGEKAVKLALPDLVMVLKKGSCKNRSDWIYAINIAEIIIKFGDKESIEFAYLFLADHLKNVSDGKGAIAFLNCLREEEVTELAIQVLLAILKREHDLSLKAAQEAIKKLGVKTPVEKAIESFIFMLANNPWIVSSVALEIPRILGQLGKKSSTEPVLNVLLPISMFSETAVQALLKLPLYCVMQNYLQSPLSFFGGVNKDYVQAVAKIIFLQGATLLYDKIKNLIILDGKVTLPLKTPDQIKLGQALVECMHIQFKTFGLSTVVAEAAFHNREAYSIPDAEDLPKACFSPEFRSSSSIDLILQNIEEAKVQQRIPQKQRGERRIGNPDLALLATSMMDGIKGIRAEMEKIASKQAETLDATNLLRAQMDVPLQLEDVSYPSKAKKYDDNVHPASLPSGVSEEDILNKDDIHPAAKTVCKL